MKPCVYAILGFGGMGNCHLDAIQQNVPELQIKGIYDIRPEAVEKAKEKQVHAYPSLDALLADRDVELVIIATPNNFHKDLSIQCLQSGKNVLCEKPVAMNAAELEEILAVAKQAGKLFTVDQNRRWDADYCIVKKILREELLGAPYFIESRVGGSWGRMFGWRGYKINGGGMLYDWGVHLLDQLMDLVDSPVVSVDGHLCSIHNEEVDDNSKLLLRFENGVSALCELSTNCFINLPRWHLSCNNGTAVVQDWECHGKMVQLSVGREVEWSDDIVYTAAGPTRTLAPRPSYMVKESPLPEVHADWNDIYRNVVGAIRGTAPLIVRPEQVLRVMKVIDLAFASSEARQGLACYI